MFFRMLDLLDMKKTLTSDVDRVPNELYPVFIIEDRYGGTYSKGKWIAMSEYDKNTFDFLQEGPHNCDPEARDFWDNEAPKRSDIAVGNTPNEALNNLLGKMGG